MCFRRHPMEKDLPQEMPSAASEWKKFLFTACLALPVIVLLLICAYGFLVWFGQILFWGPPS